MKESTLGRTYGDGEIICHEGDEGNNMFVVQDGEVEVIKKVPGGELRLTSLKKGEIVGEMSLFDHLPRSATIRSVGTSVVLSVDKKGFLAKVSKDPSLAFHVLESVSRRIRSLNNDLMDLKKAREELLGTFLDLKETCRIILNEIRQSVKAANGSIMLMDDDTGALRIIAAFGEESDRKTELRAGKGIAGDVLKTGKIEIINNVSSDDRYEPGQMKLRTLMCAPLKSGERIFGVINLSHGGDDFFNLDDMKLLRVLSVYASISIENAKLFVTSQHLCDSVIKNATLLDMS
jgi:CRP-like cAMP-binding protein